MELAFVMDHLPCNCQRIDDRRACALPFSTTCRLGRKVCLDHSYGTVKVKKAEDTLEGRMLASLKLDPIVLKYGVNPLSDRCNILAQIKCDKYQKTN